MKQKFWKQLKSRLCARQNWIQDSASARCQCCGKEFTIFRRRHHCRFCGKLFCGHCSDLYINGTYLGLSEKYVRHCEFCKEEIEKIKKDLNKLTYMVQEEEDFAKSEDEEDSGSSSDEDNQYFSIRAIFGSIQKESEIKFAEELDMEMKSMSRQMLNKLVALGNISHEYESSRLLEILLRAVVESKMNILPHDLNSRSSYMDITRHISIKTLNGNPAEYIELIRGTVLQKSLPVKHMLSRLIKPQVIVIQNSLDESAVRVKFEDLISNDHLIYEQLEERIMKFNPDIVFVEKSINRQILDFFSEKGITVISGLKKKEIAKIIHITGIRSVIKNVWAIDKYKPDHVIGNLDLMHIKKFDKNSEPLIYFQKNVGIYSILVSEKTNDQQSTLKKALQVLIKFMRMINLEKYLIYVDFEMWEEKQSKSIPRLFKINPNHISSLERMRIEEIQFYRVRLSELDLEREDKKLREYCRGRNHSHYLQLCGEGSHQLITPYSEYDSTIGHFLLVMATNFMKKCSGCKLHHRERYYFEDFGIEVSINNLKQQAEKEEIRDEEDLNVEKLHKYLKKYKQNWDIFSYFQCKSCQKILSKRAKIGKNYLKNSFYYFLYLVANCEEWSTETLQLRKASTNDQKATLYDQQPSTPRKTQLTIPTHMTRGTSRQKSCAHFPVERVLQTSDILFRMEVFKIYRFRISIIDLRQEQYQLIYRKNIKKYITEQASREIEEKFTMEDMMEKIVNGYICLLQPFRFQEPLDHKIIVQLEKLENIREILYKLHLHMEELWSKEKGKDYAYTHDWTYFGRELAKVDFILKTTVDVLRLIEAYLHKRKKKIEENELISIYSNEELDSLLDNEQREDFNPRNSKESAEAEERRKTSKESESSSEVLFLQRELSRQKSSDDDKYSVKSVRSKVSNSLLKFSQIDNQPKLRCYSEQMKRRRFQLKKGQYLYFTAVNSKKAISILVCALNSVDFKDQFERKGSDIFKFNLIVTKDIPTSWDLKQSIQKLKGEIGEEEIEPRESYEIVCYYHRQFQSFRESQGITFESYIRSLASSQSWETVGGKSNSEFAKSNDQVLVIKTIKHDEFEQFLKFASDYLRHVQVSNKSSYLAKIYGIYDINIKGDSHRCVVMENLFLGFEGLPFKRYDLKGSEVNRLFISKTTENTTGLDTNFKIDKNSHPYFIDENNYNKLIDSLGEDVNFLCKNQVIDYSLLVIEHGNQLRMGIIDYMRPYHLMEKIQNKYKELTNKMQPTVIPPQEYANRFLFAMKKYFSFSTK